MGDMGHVFRKWTSHVRNDIHKKPSMQFTKNSTAVKKLTSLYIVGDLNGTSECYVTGHGGSFDSDYVLGCQTFTVPKGITVNFYQPDGYILGFGTSALRSGNPVKHGGTNDQVYTEGEECPNYILTKDQGRHLSGDVQYAKDWEMDYSGTQAVAGDLGIVIVTIRNRWFHAGVNLKSVIESVHKEAKGITTFNCLFCRVRDGSSNDMWDAVNGNWA